MTGTLDALTRRRFLIVLGEAAALGACSAAGVSPAPVGDVAAGRVADLPVGSLRIVNALPVCIGRDAGGVYAMTLTCTHSGCDMGQTGSVTPNGLFCGCHGSEFDANGNVVRGPASQSLDHFAVTADSGGNLTIHGGQTVSASDRLAV
jgi:nitrite reductase/ring-hydroxylating ferredoxin subunit